MVRLRCGFRISASSVVYYFTPVFLSVTLPRLPQDPLHNMETYNSQDFIEYMNEYRMARRDSDDVADDPPEGEHETCPAGSRQRIYDQITSDIHYLLEYSWHAQPLSCLVIRSLIRDLVSLNCLQETGRLAPPDQCTSYSVYVSGETGAELAEDEWEEHIRSVISMHARRA